ncbi:hypothetical protein KIN20_008811 [Parelaphostrongylus tenuis]|uniref:MMS19 nucleotide excision repair protein n=1 Tax=Parelaphostrongylus tenuis TaxID=148309 RepID=A0AAD5MQX9_PARTN|nr:hypothetical protein KIN20_008811 [Parelaphostrongylus tenuis]
MAPDKGDANLYKQLLVDKQLSLSDFFEMKRSLVLSDSDDIKETAFSELIDVVSSLPHDFLSEQQVGLLLNFFIRQLDDSPITAPYSIRGINHLVLRCSNLPSGFEIPLYQTMFSDGNVRSWDTEKRFLQYGILEWLLLHRLQDLIPLGSNFVSTFVRTVEGEQHPKCLPLVFRMYIIVARSFPLGALVEEMFEIVSWYFPIEFKQTSSSDPITRGLLAHGCVTCLTAHPEFAPFCYLLIEEKLTDEECSLEQKIETCELLEIAASVFHPKDILSHLDSILGCLRALGLSPKSEMPECVPRALIAITKALSSYDSESVIKLGSQLVENLEPSVVLAQMGLTERALNLLQCVASAGPAIRSMIYDRVIPWIIMLVQGDVVSNRADRPEVIQQGLRYIATWVEIIHDHECDDVLLRFYSSIFASLDVARETAPNEALVALHNCTSTYLCITSLTDEMLMRTAEIVRMSWNTVKTEAVQTSFQRLIGVASKTKWIHVRDVIIPFSEQSKAQDFPLICSAVQNTLSYTDLSPAISSILIGSPSREFFDVFLSMATRVASISAIPLISTAQQFCSTAFKLTSPTNETVDAFAETMQSFGLLLDKENRLLLLTKIIYALTSSQLVDMFNLFLVQSQDSALMQHFVKLPVCGEQSAYRLCVGISNHEQNMEKVLSLREALRYEVSCAISKGLLLRGKEEGVKIYEELLDRFSRKDPADHEILLKHLCDIFDFDSAANNPQRCLFKITLLWKQRIFSQLGRIYISAVNRADEAGKSVLMKLLPSLLRCFENSPIMQQLFNEFLPVFRTALTNDKETDPVVLHALSRFIAGSPAGNFSSEDSHCMVKALTKTLSAPDVPLSTMLSCLDSLELGYSKIRHCLTNATIAMIISATVHALGHKKRIVRQKAAVVRNLWEVRLLEQTAV